MFHCRREKYAQYWDIQTRVEREGRSGDRLLLSVKHISRHIYIMGMDVTGPASERQVSI